MDIFRFYNLEKEAYKNLKETDSGKEFAKSMVKPGIIFALGMAVDMILGELILDKICDYIIEKTENEYVDD